MENEAHFIFTSDPIQVKSEGENFYIEGYVSTSDQDLVNDVVTKSCILDMAEQMKTRTIKMDFEHEAFRGKSKIEREINKTLNPVAKIDDFVVDKKGLKVRAMLNKHSAKFNEIKGSIDDGFLDAFSIAYVPVKAKTEVKNGQKVRRLDKINLLNIALTGNPINTEAKMTSVFMKSLESLEEKDSPLYIILDKACRREKLDKKEEKFLEASIAVAGNKGSAGQLASDLLSKIKSGDGLTWKERMLFSNLLEVETQMMDQVESMKSNNHTSDSLDTGDAIKNEEKKVVEGNETDDKKNQPANPEGQPSDPAKPEGKDAGEGQGSGEGDEGGEGNEANAEVKSLTEKLEKTQSELDATKKEVADMKAIMAKAMPKSPFSQQDKSENFVEGKSKMPLDLI